MIIQTYKTPKIVPGTKLLDIIDRTIPKLSERTIVTVTSKIISICQGRLVKNDGTVNKHALIRKESDVYIDSSESRYNVMLTIKDDVLIANAGIDESNGGGYFVLWPSDPFGQAARIWKYLRTKHNLSRLGVLVTDSRIAPLRWGTLGLGVAWCGFSPLRNYIGKSDIFGRTLRMTKQSIVDGCAAAAVVAMGEGSEQTPIAILQDVPFVKFLSAPPMKKDIEALRIRRSDDLFAPLLDSPKWQRGGIPPKD